MCDEEQNKKILAFIVIKNLNYNQVAHGPRHIGQLFLRSNQRSKQSK